MYSTTSDVTKKFCEEKGFVFSSNVVETMEKDGFIYVQGTRDEAGKPQEFTALQKACDGELYRYAGEIYNTQITSDDTKIDIDFTADEYGEVSVDGKVVTLTGKPNYYGEQYEKISIWPSRDIYNFFEAYCAPGKCGDVKCKVFWRVLLMCEDINSADACEWNSPYMVVFV